MTTDHFDSVHSVAQYALYILQDEFPNGVSVASPQRFEIPAGSTQVVTEIAGVGAHAVVLVSAPVAIGVPPSPEVFEFVARQGGRPSLGSLVVVDHPDGTLLNVFVVHHIYGSCLDRAELLTSVANVASQADDLDEEFVSRFGGQRLTDVVSESPSI